MMMMMIMMMMMMMIRVIMIMMVLMLMTIVDIEINDSNDDVLALSFLKTFDTLMHFKNCLTFPLDLFRFYSGNPPERKKYSFGHCPNYPGPKTRQTRRQNTF